jgi:hypothetical protein
MAREIIHAEDGIDVLVGWQPGGNNVEIASFAMFRSDWDTDPKLPTKEERIQQACGGLSGPIGFYGSIRNRRDINKVIHLLRRARDSAFGRDA